MNLIDTHAHIYAEQFDEDRAEVIARARDVGVGAICMPNIDRDSVPSMYQMEEDYPELCHAMMGLHPCSVKEDYEEQLDWMEIELDRRDFIAVGEIGLDYYWDKSFVPQQKKAFDRQISWALECNLPIVIHSRDSISDAIDMVAARQNGDLSGVFHCFGETRTELDRIKDLGFFVGLGGVLTYKKVKLREELKRDDLPYIVLETDCPYLAPVPKRGKRNECSFVSYVHQHLAEAMNLSESEIAAITTKNAYKLFPRLPRD